MEVLRRVNSRPRTPKVRVPYASTATARAHWRMLSSTQAYCRGCNGCAASLSPFGWTNTVNLINANAPIVVRPHGVLRSATYHVWDLYQNHTEAITARLLLDDRVDALPPRAHARQLGGDVGNVRAWNCFDDSEKVATRDMGSVAVPEGTYTFPAHSITLLTFQTH